MVSWVCDADDAVKRHVEAYIPYTFVHYLARIYPSRRAIRVNRLTNMQDSHV